MAGQALAGDKPYLTSEDLEKMDEANLKLEKPITLEEPKNRVCEPVWIISQDFEEWGIIISSSIVAPYANELAETVKGRFLNLSAYNDSWTAYDPNQGMQNMIKTLLPHGKKLTICNNLSRFLYRKQDRLAIY